MNPDLKKATIIEPGATLATRDGTRIGNAIVIRLQGIKLGKQIWKIETDFGNQANFTAEEIDELFTLSFLRTYNDWSADRRDLINSTRVEPA